MQVKNEIKDDNRIAASVFKLSSVEMSTKKFSENQRE